MLDSFLIQVLCDLHAVRDESVSESLAGVSHCFKLPVFRGLSKRNAMVFAEVQWIDPNDCGKGVVCFQGEAMPTTRSKPFKLQPGHFQPDRFRISLPLEGRL